ncbi:MAG: Ig-like domain-containing protein, partial [Nitrosotalea sp.]
PKNFSVVSGVININLDINELNLAQKDWLTIKIPKQIFHDVKNIQFNTTSLTNGNYTIEAIAKDRAGNIKTANIVLTVDHSSLGVSSLPPPHQSDQNYTTLIEIIIGIAIASTITVFTLKKLKILKRS